jgi:hypothetical protein
MAEYKKLTLRAWSIFSLAVLLGCSVGAEEDLEQAMHAVLSMSSPSYLSRSCYSVLHPEGKSSDYVRYLFSDLGVAEWPPVESEEDAFTAELKKSGRPVFPEGVAILYEKADPDAEKQIVVRSDAENNEVIYEGWLKGMTAPVLTRKRQIKSVTPNANAQAMCESGLQLGANSQYPG